MVNVQIKNLTKKFGKIVAVENLSLSIKDKEFVVLLGPSGCGKTTTLRSIAGLEKVDEGEIIFGRKIINEVPPQDRNIGMVFQKYALYPHMNVYRNLAFPLETRKTHKREINRRVKNVAQLLKIENFLERKPAKLSGGEKQRVALGKAIIRNPVLFLMDEPLSNIDAKLRTRMRTELRKLHEEIGATTIYVTHDQVEAMTMADRVALMNSGKLMQYGTAEEVYNHPLNKFVAGFIGSPATNLVGCSLMEKGTSSYLDAGEFKIGIEKQIAGIIKREATSSELIFGIRPENIFMHDEKAENSIESEVYSIEYLGSETLAGVKADGYILRIKIQGIVHAKIGDKVWLAFDKDKMYIFDKKTEKALVY